MVSGAESLNVLSDSDHNARILVSLHDGIDAGGMQAMIGVNFGTANPYMFDVQENFVSFQVFRFRGRGVVLHHDGLGCGHDNFSHIVVI